MLRLMRFFYESRWVTFLVFAVFGHGMIRHDLRQDGLLYAAVSKSVLHSPDPLIMHSGDLVYLNKPPLFFWINAVFIKIFGSIPFAAKMGGFLSFLILSWLLFYIARKIFISRHTGIVSVFAVCTSYTVYQNTFTNRMEGMVSMFIVLSLLMLMKFMEDRKNKWLYLWGFTAGLAVLVKGPLGFLTIITGLAYFILFDRAIFKENFKGLTSSLVIFALTFAWWYAYAILNSDFLNVFFNEQVMERVQGEGEFNGGQNTPLYEYFRFIAQRYFIYIPFLLFGFYKAFRNHRGKPELRLWAVTMVIHFALIHLVSTRDDRYLYQFYVFASIFTAYGIYSIKHFDYEKVVIGFAAIYASLLLVYPYPLNWDSYKCLIEANRISKLSGMPIVGQERWREDIGYNAAMTFFLDRYSYKAPEDRPYLFIAGRGYEPKDSERVIGRSRRVRTVLVRPVEIHERVIEKECEPIECPQGDNGTAKGITADNGTAPVNETTSDNGTEADNLTDNLTIDELKRDLEREIEKPGLHSTKDNATSI